MCFKPPINQDKEDVYNFLDYYTRHAHLLTCQSNGPHVSSSNTNKKTTHVCMHTCSHVGPMALACKRYSLIPLSRQINDVGLIVLLKRNKAGK